jgi:hypothetical protein
MWILIAKMVEVISTTGVQNLIPDVPLTAIRSLVEHTPDDVSRFGDAAEPLTAEVAYNIRSVRILRQSGIPGSTLLRRRASFLVLATNASLRSGGKSPGTSTNQWRPRLPHFF